MVAEVIAVVAAQDEVGVGELPALAEPADHLGHGIVDHQEFPRAAAESGIRVAHGRRAGDLASDERGIGDARNIEGGVAGIGQARQRVGVARRRGIGVVGVMGADLHRPRPGAGGDNRLLGEPDEGVGGSAAVGPGLAVVVDGAWAPRRPDKAVRARRAERRAVLEPGPGDGEVADERGGVAGCLERDGIGLPEIASSAGPAALVLLSHCPRTPWLAA